MKKLFVWEDLEDWAYILKNYEHIEDYYTHIRLFHACKPTDIESYYLKGIQSLDMEYVRDIAHDIFNSNKFPEIKVEDMDDAISKSYIEELNQRAKYNICVNTDLKYSNAPFIDFSIPIGGVIHPSCITSHYHPKRIKDPIDNNKTYVSDSNECSRCSKEGVNEKI